MIALDNSEAQLELAKGIVPGARFVKADMSDVFFLDSTFAGVTAFYSISHLPR
ncbi:MAG TPA: class I SAM-dependent methyltransferase [Candidatus Nanopelagicaceae bacterium]|nr:class I SAM-dependent methyltransferase [Candidatus Nanopelagicaceae bacterium]